MFLLKNTATEKKFKLSVQKKTNKKNVKLLLAPRLNKSDMKNIENFTETKTTTDQIHGFKEKLRNLQILNLLGKEKPHHTY